jgi:uncharacterized SAM-binding protein YcdF (DUF218 family)
VSNPHTYLHLHLPRPPRLGWRGRLLLGASLLGTTYLLGFALFVVTLPPPFTTLPPGLEALATFTGGAGRVAATLTEMERGFSGPILISGSHRSTRLSDILAETATTLTPSQRTHILHDAAQTTRQNITSLMVWAGYQNLQHIGIITSTYHARRVRLLARLHAPELNLTLLPVQPADAGLMPLFREYNKLLAAPFLR